MLTDYAAARAHLRDAVREAFEHERAAYVAAWTAHTEDLRDLAVRLEALDKEIGWRSLTTIEGWLYGATSFRQARWHLIRCRWRIYTLQREAAPLRRRRHQVAMELFELRMEHAAVRNHCTELLEELPGMEG